MSLKILNLQLDFGLRAILKKFLIFANFQPPIFIKMIVIKTNGVYMTIYYTRHHVFARYSRTLYFGPK